MALLRQDWNRAARSASRVLNYSEWTSLVVPGMSVEFRTRIHGSVSGLSKRWRVIRTFWPLLLQALPECVDTGRAAVHAEGESNSVLIALQLPAFMPVWRKHAAN